MRFSWRPQQFVAVFGFTLLHPELCESSTI